MLKHKTITFYIQRYKQMTVYNSSKEILAMHSELAPRELVLYLHVRDMVFQNVAAEELQNASLEKALNMSKRSVSDIKTSLKKKGWLIITMSKNADNRITAEVYAGKEQVLLYNLGIPMEISDSRAYKKLLKAYPITMGFLTPAARKQMVEEMNQYITDHPEEFK